MISIQFLHALSLTSTRHELQIFFRMEILRSLIILNVSESMKQKFVKDICLLLEAIQCHLEGGFLESGA